MDKFILGNDPKRDGESRFYIVHLQDPIAIFRLEDKPDNSAFFKTYIFEGDDIVLCLHHWGAVAEVIMAEKLADEAWAWYRDWLSDEA